MCIRLSCCRFIFAVIHRHLYLSSLVKFSSTVPWKTAFTLKGWHPVNIAIYDLFNWQNNCFHSDLDDSVFVCRLKGFNVHFSVSFVCFCAARLCTASSGSCNRGKPLKPSVWRRFPPNEQEQFFVPVNNGCALYMVKLFLQLWNERCL